MRASVETISNIAAHHDISYEEAEKYLEDRHKQGQKLMLSINHAIIKYVKKHNPEKEVLSTVLLQLSAHVLSDIYDIKSEANILDIVHKIVKPAYTEMLMEKIK